MQKLVNFYSPHFAFTPFFVYRSFKQALDTTSKRKKVSEVAEGT
jgi:hypothetical protein